MRQMTTVTSARSLSWLVSILLLVSLAKSAFGRQPGTPVSGEDVTIVYNADEKEFVCWFEGTAKSTADSEMQKDTDVTRCPYVGSHPYRDNLYFYRGQTISILVVGAKVGDIYTADLKVDNLEQPSIPVYGGVTQLPSLQAIQPAEQLVLAAGSKLAAGAAPLAQQLYTSLDKLAPADFQNLLKQNIFDPASKSEIQQLANGAVRRTLNGIATLLNDKSPLVSNATLMCTDVETRKSTLDKFRKNYCVTIATATTKPTTGIYLDFDTYLQEIKKLSRLADRQKALKAQVDVSGLTSQAKDLANLVALSSNTAVQTALSPNFKETKQLLNAFTIEFGPVPSIGDINNVKLDPGGSKYVDFSGGVKPNGMLEKINAAIGAAGTKPDAKSLSILKTNLAYIALNFSSIDASVSQLSDAQQAVSDLNTYLASPSSTSCSSPPKNIIEFQAILNKMALDVIDAADSANCAAQSIPLPEPISRPLVDQWYGNKQVTVTLTKNTRVPLFDVNSYGPPALIGSTSVTSTPSGSASSDQAAPKKTTDSSQQKGAQNPGSNPSSPPGADASKGTSTPAPATSSSGTVVRQTAFRVHDVYRYELGFGFMRSNVKDVKYQLVQQTSTTNGTSTTSQFFVQTRNRSYHFLPTVDLLVYPIKRDYFPWKPRFYKEKPPAWWTRFAGLLGFSLSSPTSDFFLGSAYMPNAGIGLKAGLHLSYVDSLPAGVKLGVPITATSTHVEQKFDHGYFIGVEFNAQLFKDTLGVILKK